MKTFHYASRAWLFWLVIAGIVVMPLAAGAEAPQQNATSFDERLDVLLRTQVMSEQQRNEVVTDCVQLLAEFPEHEQRPKVMFLIAQLYGLTIRQAGLESKPEQSVSWYRQVIKEATAGSTLWCRASIYTASQLRNFSNGRIDLTEARALLEAVVEKSDSPTMRLRAEMGLMDQSFYENNPLGIELHAHRILDWKAETDEEALVSDQDRQFIEGVKYAAARQLIELAVNASNLDGIVTARVAGTKAQRIDYVNELVERYPLPPLRQFADQAIARIDEASDLPPPPQYASIPLEVESSPLRKTFLAINIAVVVTLGAILAVRWKQQRSVP